MHPLHRLLLTALLFTPGLAPAQEVVVDLPTRPGITVRALYAKPDVAPRASAVLLAGGHGALKIYPNGTLGWGERGFLVRAREQLVQQGIAVMLLDAPSDHRGGLSGWRHTPEHAADVGAAIAWLRKQSAAPVWLIGHSRGSESAVAAAVTLGSAPAGPDGLVLASAILTEVMLVPGKAVVSYPMEQLNVPLLALHHDSDSCTVTLPRHLPALEKKLASMPGPAPHSVVRLQGGSPLGAACEHEGQHGFGGQDTEAMQAIAAFILAYQPSATPAASAPKAP